MPICICIWRSGSAALILQALSRSLKKMARAPLVLAAVLGVSIAPALPTFAQEVASPAPFTISTLDTIRTRGYVVCAATSPLPGFAQISPEGLWSGFDIDLCRALGAAVFGDPSRVEFRPLTGQSRFVHLMSGEVDVVTRNGPWTMSRDTAYGATFVTTSFYDGQAFMAPTQLGLISAYEIEDVTICASIGSEAERQMQEFFFLNQLDYDVLNYEDRDDLALAYRGGRCDVITGSASWLQALRRTLPEPSSHSILPERLSKETFGPVVRSNDVQWETIVRWTIYSLVNAEELGVTSTNIESMLSARTPAIRRLLGVEGSFGSNLGLRDSWMRDVIAAVGNYGEVYNRHFGGFSGAPLLRGQNALWSNGGLMFAPPLR